MSMGGRNKMDGANIPRARLALELLEPRLLLSAGLTETIATEQGEVEVAAGQIIVGFEDGSCDPQDLLAGYEGSALLWQYEMFPGVMLGLPDDHSVQQGLDVVKGLGGVKFVEPNYVVSAAQLFPDDPDFTELWGMHNTGQSGGTADADIDAPEGWEIATGSSDVIVGIIDTGIDYTHPDLAANIWTNPGEIPGNGIDDDGNGYIDDVYGWNFFNDDNDPMDDHGHGTHVAGTVGAVGDNALGVTGVAWSVSLAALKFLGADGSGFTSDAVRAVEYATMMGFDITNNSWGGGGFSLALYEAIEAAGAAGQLFVAAAGNDGLDNDTFPQYPSSYDLDNIIAVAATDDEDALAGFSNYGATSVDLAAPGVSIYSTTMGGGYGTMSGTSMASPHVAGAAAVLKSFNPLQTPADLKAALLTGVDSLPALTGLMVSGGRLNLNGALGAAIPPVEGVDLVPLTPQFIPDGLFGLTSVQISYSVRNLGDTATASDFDISFYLSDDDALGGGDDIFLATDTVTGGLPAFGTASGTILVTGFPPSDPFGTDRTYFLLAEADSGDDVVEAVEDNNLASAPADWTHATVFYDDFSTDMGWSGLQSDRWERGAATAGGGEFGFPDPGTDTTPTDDNFILGYNIGGDYENNITSTRWVTSPVIDCTGLFEVTVQFQRWLNVEHPWWDHAYFQVYSGSSWATVFENSDQISDSSWQLVEFDVSAYADENPAFRMRFGMGPTDSSWRFSGWNIDDINVVGALVPDSVPPVVTDVAVAHPHTVLDPTVIAVQFNERMAGSTLEDTDNYSLVESATMTPIAIDSISAGESSVELSVETLLLPGVSYRLTLEGDTIGAIADIWGNLLDGNADGTQGDDFIYDFGFPGIQSASVGVYGGYITFYDTDAAVMRDVNVHAVADIRGNDTVGIMGVVLRPQYSPFGVVIEQKPGSSQGISVIDRTFRPHPIAFVIVDGNVDRAVFRSNLDGMPLGGLSLGMGVTLPQDVDGDGETDDATAFVCFGDLGLYRSQGHVTGDVVVHGSAGRMIFGNSHSSFAADVVIDENLGLLRSTDPVGGWTSVGGSAGAFRALGGTAEGFGLEVEGDLDLFLSVGTVMGDVLVGDDLDFLLVRADDTVALADDVSVGGNLGRARFVGDVLGNVTVGGSGGVVVVTGDTGAGIVPSGADGYGAEVAWSGMLSFGNGLTRYVNGGVFSGALMVTGDVDRVVMRDGVDGALIDINSSLAKLIVRGDFVRSACYVDGPLDLVNITGEFYASWIDAATLDKVKIREGIGSDEGDYEIHAESGAFLLIEEGRRHLVDESHSLWFDDVHVWVGEDD